MSNQEETEDVINQKQMVIKDSLSHARLATFEDVTEDLSSALDLYLWNAEISGLFFPCLQVCEVVIRNSVALALTRLHGEMWVWEHGFTRSLPKGMKEELERAKSRFFTVDKVIPELKFFFWQQLFTRRHDNRLWSLHLDYALPNLDKNLTIAERRKLIFDNLEQVRRLRNRIAHHEPIFNRNLVSDYQTILALIGYHSQTTANWLDRNQKVSELLTKQPVVKMVRT